MQRTERCTFTTELALVCAERSLGPLGTRGMTIIGKSLASLLADLVNERGLPAVWLTPVLTDSAVVGALARADRPTLGFNPASGCPAP